MFIDDEKVRKIHLILIVFTILELLFLIFFCVFRLLYGISFFKYIYDTPDRLENVVSSSRLVIGVIIELVVGLLGIFIKYVICSCVISFLVDIKIIRNKLFNVNSRNTILDIYDGHLGKLGDIKPFATAEKYFDNYED